MTRTANRRRSRLPNPPLASSPVSGQLCIRAASLGHCQRTSFYLPRSALRIHYLKRSERNELTHAEARSLCRIAWALASHCRVPRRCASGCHSGRDPFNTLRLSAGWPVSAAIRLQRRHAPARYRQDALHIPADANRHHARRPTQNQDRPSSLGAGGGRMQPASASRFECPTPNRAVQSAV